MTPSDLLIISLFAWRAAYFLVKEEGPFALMLKVRTRVSLGGVLLCIYCTSIWTALLGYVMTLSPLAPLVYIGAVSGGAMMLWRWTGGEHG